MPICIVTAPAGLAPEAKKQLMKDLTAACEEGYPPSYFVTEIWLQEVPADAAMIAGVVALDNPAFNPQFKKKSAS